MFAIAWKTLRARRAAFAGAFTALFCGAAVITASGILLESGVRSTVPPERYAGADVMVGGNQTLRIPGGDLTVAERLPERVTLPSEVRDAVAAVPGVRAAVGDYDVPVAIAPVEGDAVVPAAPRVTAAHGWDSAVLGPFSPDEGRAPESDSEVVLDAALAAAVGVSPGDEVRIVAAAAPAVYRVAGTVTAPPGAPLERSHTVFLTPAEAARLSGHPGRFDAVGVLAEDGADPGALARSIEDAVPEVTTYTGTAAGRLEFADVAASRSLLTLVAASFGGMAMLVSLFVVAITLALSVHQRRREFAVLRAIGSTPRQIRRLVVGEALLVAAFGGVLGCLPGIVLADVLRGLFARIGVVPDDLPLAVGPLPPLVAVLLVAGTAALGGLATAHRPARISPVEALREAAVDGGEPPRWRRTAGAVCLGAGAVAALTPLYVRGEVGAAGTGSAALLMVIGLALLGPVVPRRLVRLLGAPLRGGRVTGFLAAANSEAGARRTGSALVPLVLAIGFTVTLVYTQSTLAAAAVAQTREGLAADLVLADTGSGGVAAEVVEEVRSTPGVAVVTSVTPTTVFVPFTVFEDRDLAALPARGVDPDGLAATVDLGIADGDIAELRGDAVAMERSQAELLGRGVGDTVEMYLGDGTPVELTLVATYERGIGFGTVTLPREVLEGRTTALPGRLLVRTAEDADPAAVAAALDALGERHPTLSLVDRDGFASGARAEAALAGWVNLVGLAVILGYIAIAVVNTLVMATAGRSREFALLRLVGMSRWQVLRVAGWEALLLVGAAALLGTAVAVLPLAALGTGLLGVPLPAGPPLVYPAVVAGAALLGVLSVLVPTWACLRGRPVEAVGVRE
ncbi:ABC transporter permease [Marinitenerispora sediminis]|uniref:ABC transporter permease n=1 Tax=Marinitenerispora sediminis TaxID=1931232 RepID=A0A368T803_9ACTN|nr:ABC transporter permease [Marinitenerispora sediminis]RCV51206.1 ABC transporter permease [Marinitenerispora sediminis]RCV56444.1 ABC transporter permease [Marinitenerispora sediminis]RCV60163.1 ABC transporter permease [Marinitenerispora sediminis]